MAALVFDACALIALAEKEEGADLLASFLANQENICFVHWINLCEVYYHVLRHRTRKEAGIVIKGFLELSVILRDDADIDFLREAGELKAVHKRVSLADCCAVALANRLDAELVTSDHHEFDILADQGVCKFVFFR